MAIDASDANIRIATAHAQKDPMLRQRLNIHSSSSNPSGSLQYRHTTTSSLIEEGKTFDVVCALEVVEHVSEPSQFLKECSELVRVCLIKFEDGFLLTLISQVDISSYPR